MSLSVVEAAPVVEAAEPAVEAAEEPAKKKKKRKRVAAAPVVEAPAPGYYLHLSNITNLILFIILQVIRT